MLFRMCFDSRKLTQCLATIMSVCRPGHAMPNQTDSETQIHFSFRISAFASIVSMIIVIIRCFMFELKCVYKNKIWI